MELLNAKLNKEGKLVLNLSIDKKDFVDGDESIGTVNACNEITFDTLEKAETYFDKVYKQNKNIIENNKERLEQCDGDILKLNDFVHVIEKSNALSKRNSEKIENLVEAYHQMRNLKHNIESTEKQNEVNKQILNKIQELKK